ncbi:MAG: hypothetical protein ABSC62_14935 [Terracidiphilus sp.]|jgi:hypothetical protein
MTVLLYSAGKGLLCYGVRVINSTNIFWKRGKSSSICLRVDQPPVVLTTDH